jgi:hypothetical protein
VSLSGFTHSTAMATHTTRERVGYRRRFDPETGRPYWEIDPAGATEVRTLFELSVTMTQKQVAERMRELYARRWSPSMVSRALRFRGYEVDGIVSSELASRAREKLSANGRPRARLPRLPRRS